MHFGARCEKQVCSLQGKTKNKGVRQKMYIKVPIIKYTSLQFNQSQKGKNDKSLQPCAKEMIILFFLSLSNHFKVP